MYYIRRCSTKERNLVHMCAWAKYSTMKWGWGKLKLRAANPWSHHKLTFMQTSDLQYISIWQYSISIHKGVLLSRKLWCSNRTVSNRVYSDGTTLRSPHNKTLMCVTSWAGIHLIISQFSPVNVWLVAFPPQTVQHCIHSWHSQKHGKPPKSQEGIQ